MERRQAAARPRCRRDRRAIIMKSRGCERSGRGPAEPLCRHLCQKDVVETLPST